MECKMKSKPEAIFGKKNMPLEMEIRVSSDRNVEVLCKISEFKVSRFFFGFSFDIFLANIFSC